MYYILVVQWKTTPRQTSTKSNSELLRLLDLKHFLKLVSSCWTYHHMPCLVAIVMYGQLQPPSKDNGNSASKTNQTADVLVENQLQPPMDLVTAQECKLHRPDSRTECRVIHSAYRATSALA